LVNSIFGRRVSGSGHHVYTLWKYLQNKVEFGLWNVSSVGYINIPKLKSISFFLKARMKRVPEDADIIHVHNPKFAGLFEKDRKNLLTIHGDYYTELKLEYGRFAMPIIWYIDRTARKADVITTVSPHWSRIRGWKWVPNMIELSEIREIQPADESYLLFVGRDDPIKNYPMFREIAKLAFRRFRIKSLALGVIRKDAEYLRHARVPWEQVISYMKSAVALVITSKQEGLPTTLLEAWASGCPVIANGIPPLKVIHDMHKGALLLFDDVNEALLRINLVSTVGDVREITVKKGYEAVKYFDAPKVANQYYDLYRRLLSE